jgi:tetratricopeptide (TPR) repeat protein
MKKQLNTLLIIFISLNLFSQVTKIEFEDEIDEIFTKMELQGIKTNSDLLYGYFFYGKDDKLLKELSSELKKEGFKFVRAETIEDNETIILHLEKVEKMTRNDLRKREKFLNEIAGRYKTDYDGWDVGNANSEIPLTTQEAFIEYLKGLSEDKLFEDSKKLYQIEDYSNALIGFDISVQREIKIDTSTFYLGCCLAKLGDNDNGLLILKQVVEDFPKFEKAAYVVGAVSYDIRNFDDSIHYYEKVIKLNPKNDDAYYGLATAEYGKKDFTKSKEYCNKALEINPDNKMAKDLLEWFD